METSGTPPTNARRVSVRIETPRGSFVKRDLVDGELRVAFVSPVRCPFDYGQVVGEAAPDGMGRDALWLGERRKPLDLAEGIVAAVVRFEDDGLEDDKWIVTPDGVLADADSKRIRRFFRLYAAVKRVRGKRARFGGIAAP